MSTGEPTCWSTDLNKTPDLFDFAITKGISDIYTSIKSNLDMSSDHSPIVITLNNHVIWKKPPLQLCDRNTNWTQIQNHINDNINLNLQLKTDQDLEDAVEYISKLIQQLHGHQHQTGKRQYKTFITFHSTSTKNIEQDAFGKI
jgi:hypothetical protein